MERENNQQINQQQINQQMQQNNNVNKQEDNKLKKQFIVLVLLLLMAISVGFANLSSTLRINGTSTIIPMKWDVHFENVSDSSNNATVVVPATIKGNTTDLEYEVQLQMPGSYYEFTVDIKNGGSIDAKLANAPALTGISQEQRVYTNYTVTYSNGNEIKEGDVINAGESRKILVKIEIDPNVTSGLLPTTEQQLNLGVNLDYIQAE